jgi:hypothetical protein
MLHDQPSQQRPETVKGRLTPKTPVENDEYAEFVRRIFRAYARRIASGDIDALAGMVSFTADIEAIIQQVVTRLRDQHGYSWAEIGLRLGVTRQAAQQRWGTQP